MIRFNSFNYGSLFGYGSGSSLYSNLSQLSSVRSGSYAKALKSYYGRNNQTASTQKNSAVNKYNYNTYTQQSGLSNVSKESTDLSAAAKKLTDTGKEGLFASEEKYDADAAYKAASDFVTNYNETLDAVNKTTNAAVNSAAGSMTRMTGVMTKSLSGIGIRLSSAAEQQSRQMSLGSTGLYGRYGSYFGNYGFGGSRFDGWI